MYLINEISNRDLSLLYDYRILRYPSDFLPAVYTQSDPIYTEIKEGFLSEYKTESGESVYGYSLRIEMQAGKIPYLEFNASNEIDRKRLESLLYLENDTIYGLLPRFSDTVQIRIFWMSSLADIESSIDKFLKAIENLSIDALWETLDQRKNTPKSNQTVSGRNENLLEFTKDSAGISMQDSDYMITSALDAQLLVNPSQELLMTLPRVLKHSINISITDGGSRYLSSFSGFSINIRGNGSWVMRDIKSSINFVDGTGKIYLMNCAVVHFRTSVDSGIGGSNSYICSSLYAHRTLVILNQGRLQDVTLVGGSVLIEVPASVNLQASSTDIVHIALVGYGCSVYSWIGKLPILPENIQGTAWWFNPMTKDSALYIAGKRVDEIGGEHDAELHPKDIIRYDIDNIHISLGGD